SLANFRYVDTRLQGSSRDRERTTGRREVETVTRAAEPEWAAAAAGGGGRRVVALVHPGGSQCAAHLGERARMVSSVLHESEDRLRVHCHLRLCALDPVPGEECVVVLDDTVVDADDPAVSDRVVVGLDLGVA